MNTESLNATLQVINTRRSVGILVEPAPSQTQLETAIQSALAAPDHRQLTPWRFYSIFGDALADFGSLLVQANQENGITDADKLAKVAKHPLRAPMIIVCVTKVVKHIKVPDFEQLLSTGSAIQNMLLTFEAMGYGTMWRSGDVIHSKTLKQAFNAGDDDYISGFIYVGTKEKPPRQKPARKVSDFLTEWQA